MSGRRSQAEVDPPRRRPSAGGAYDAFAWLYDRDWGDISLAFVPALDRLVLGGLPPNARILDLACGTGQLAAALAERGFRVTGLDASAGMLALASSKTRAAEFVLGDARSFVLPERFDAVLSVFDSLNHIMTLSDLRDVFARVRAALVPGGRFVFDLMTAEGYPTGSRDALVRDDHVAVIRTRYDRATKRLRFDATLFRRSGEHWERTDIVLHQRSYSDAQVRRALRDAGLVDIAVHRAEDLDLRAAGRVFYAVFAPS